MNLKYINCILLLTLSIFVLFSRPVFAQSAEEFTMKTAFIVKMTHFINWPEDLNTSEETEKFTICIDGSRKYFSNLEDWAKSGVIKQKPVSIEYINHNLTGLERCNILFITNNTNLNTYLKVARKKRFLTISDQPGNAQRGVVVNFFNIDDNLRFEINLDVARNLGFTIKPNLLKLAKIVSTREDK